jgi:hypothetical protein
LHLLALRVIHLFVLGGNYSVGFFVNGGPMQLRCKLVVENKDVVVVSEEAVDVFKRSVGGFRVE